LQFLGEAADNDIALLTKAQLSAYRAHLLPSLSGRTINKHLVIIRMLFRCAKRDGLIIDDPSEFVGAVKQSDTGTRAKRRAFTIPELEAVIGVAVPEWRSMSLFGLYTGQRLMDIAKLSWANIDLERNELRLVTAKTGARVILPLAAPLRAHTESLPGTDALAAHVHPRAAAAVHVSVLSAQFALLLIQTGLREPTTTLTKEHSARRTQHELSFHSLRHTVVSMMHAVGVTQAVSETFAGHSSGAVHQLYIHADRESLQRAADTLPLLQRLDPHLMALSPSIGTATNSWIPSSRSARNWRQPRAPRGSADATFSCALKLGPFIQTRSHPTPCATRTETNVVSGVAAAEAKAPKRHFWRASRRAALADPGRESSG
jgi:integrase